MVEKNCFDLEQVSSGWKLYKNCENCGNSDESCNQCTRNSYLIMKDRWEPEKVTQNEARKALAFLKNRMVNSFEGRSDAVFILDAFIDQNTDE